MINHARTLLLNRLPAIAGDPTVPGGTYVPPDFVPVVLPSALEILSRTLFGASPDRHLLAYRGWEYLTILHATELVEYVLALDSRITYAPSRPDPDLLLAAFLPTQNQTSGTSADLLISGQARADDQRGLAFYHFAVSTNGTTVTVTQFEPTPTAVTTVTPPALGGGMGFVTLGVSGLTAAVPMSGGAASWDVRAAARPTRTMDQIFAQVQGVLDTVRQRVLFGNGSDDPLATCRQLYVHHPALPYRFAAVLLALIYRTAQLRGDV